MGGGDMLRIVSRNSRSVKCFIDSFTLLSSTAASPNATNPPSSLFIILPSDQMIHDCFRQILLQTVEFVQRSSFSTLRVVNLSASVLAEVLLDVLFVAHGRASVSYDSSLRLLWVSNPLPPLKIVHCNQLAEPWVVRVSLVALEGFSFHPLCSTSVNKESDVTLLIRSNRMPVFILTSTSRRADIEVDANHSRRRGWRHAGCQPHR